jgi:hypothetical protein
LWIEIFAPPAGGVSFKLGAVAIGFTFCWMRRGSKTRAKS